MGYQAGLISYSVVNRILLCIANPLKKCRFTSICPPDNEDAEVSVSGPEFRSFYWVDREGGAASTGAASTGAASTGAASTGAASTGAASTGAAPTGAAEGERL